MRHLKMLLFLCALTISLQADITEIYRESVGESPVIPRPTPKTEAPKQSKILSNLKKEFVEEAEPEQTQTAQQKTKANHSWQTHKLIDWEKKKRKKKRRRWRKRRRNH